ncbi:glutamate-ammonia-ligase adenylyltransferase [Mycobacterium tuberculosis variant bovis BCG]|nr:glutamate-ammonia-ligase adenylyltransferase [Mycobacterium tuberculosis variant bovis BCG]
MRLILVPIPPQLSQTLTSRGSTNPSRPTLGNFGRCVASLVTTTTVAQSASASDQPVDLGYSDR